MASGHDTHDTHDAHGHDDHGHGHDDHGDHATGGDAWVIPPLVIGFVIGIVIVALLGLAIDAAPFA